MANECPCMEHEDYRKYMDYRADAISRAIISTGHEMSMCETAGHEFIAKIVLSAVTAASVEDVVASMDKVVAVIQKKIDGIKETLNTNVITRRH